MNVQENSDNIRQQIVCGVNRASLVLTDQISVIINLLIGLDRVNIRWLRKNKQTKGMIIRMSKYLLERL